jgi:hypothetical protein
MVLRDGSRELVQAIRATGPIILSTTSPISLILPTVTGGSSMQIRYRLRSTLCADSLPLHIRTIPRIYQSPQRFKARWFECKWPFS